MRSYYRFVEWALPIAALLAGGIGTSAAVLILLQVSLWEPVPVENPARLLHLGGLTPSIAGLSVQDWWAQSKTVRRLTFYKTVRVIGTTASGRRPIHLAVVDPAFFAVFRQRATRGRLLDDGDKTTPTIVISERLWRGDYQSDARVLGRRIDIRGHQYTIIGVAGTAFEFPRSVEGWVLHTPTDPHWASFVSPRQGTWEGPLVGAAGVLADGASVATARSEFTSLLRRLNAIVLPRSGVSAGNLVFVLPLRERITAESRPALLALGMGAVVLLLLTSVNSGLLLANRGVARRREFAIRQVVGATPFRLGTRVMGETASVILVATGLAVVIAYWTLRVFEEIASLHGLYAATASAGSVRVLSVTAAVACLTCGLVAGIPAISVLRGNLLSSLQQTGQVGGGRSSLVRQILVGLELMLAVLILGSAAIAWEYLQRLARHDTGILSASALESDLELDARDGDALRRWNEYLADASEIPGVRSAAIGDALPFEHNTGGVLVLSERSSRLAALRVVSAKFFAAAGISIVRGDEPVGERSVALPISLARQLLGSDDVIGRSILLEGEARPRVVAAVVRDVRPFELAGEPQPVVYLLHTATFHDSMPPLHVHAFVRCDRECGQDTRRALDDLSFRRSIRSERARPLSAVLDERLSPARVRLAIGIAYSIFALALAAAAVYGLAQSVSSSRAAEAGVRMALGAPRRSIIAGIVLETCRAGLVGVLFGLLCLVVVERLVGSVLPSVPPLSLVSIIGAACLSIGCVCMAAGKPALLLAQRPPIDLIREASGQL